MLVSVRLDLRAARLWHEQLLDRLTRRPGVSVILDPVEDASVDPRADILFRVEMRVYGRSGSGPASRIPAERLDPYRATAAAAPDLVIDLTGAAPACEPRLWRLTFDDRPGESALLDAVLGRRVPIAVLREGERVIAAARPGTESTGILLSTFEDMLARTIGLICGAFDGAAPRVAGGDVAPDVTGSPRREHDVVREAVPTVRHHALRRRDGVPLFAAKAVARRVVRSLYRLGYHSPHWRTGWRKIDGADLFDLRRHPSEGWQILADDATRFYADPFPLVHGGGLTLFVEDFPHETGKGVISAVRFDRDGPIGRPEPVLELPYHLSYPFVFERDGEAWMIPESCAAQTVDLFRATRFPGGWVKEATLLEGLVASDATLCEFGGRWWMFATVRDGGSYSDALHLWSAPDFRGPFKPHIRNPVLIDIAGARPAGRMVERDGALLRPVQDCRAGYGAALGIARVGRLDDEDFTQEVETVIGPDAHWPGRRLHTLNQAGGFEFIDGSGWARRTWLPRSSDVTSP